MHFPIEWKNTNTTFTAIFDLCGLIIIIMPVITMAANSLVIEVIT